MTIDLRSDTVTQPTPAMLDAMKNAQTGDDVFGEDPTINMLEEKISDLFGMENALFCPSGTMANQIGIKLHTQAGDEIICEAESHVYIYEGGGVAFNSGCQVRPVPGDRGRLRVEMIEKWISPNDVHKAPTTLVSLENTSNRGGGSYYELQTLLAIKELCLAHNLKLHLDGARLFNALVASGQAAADFGKIFDTISVCLSKGLGAPVGSLLLGNYEHIKKARRYRKVLGGGMRQAGYLAAAGIYALDHHVHRLDTDHEHAKVVARALLDRDFCGHMLPVDTNIILFEVIEKYTPVELCKRLEERGILCFPVGHDYVRMVFHLGISEAMVEQIISVIEVL